MKVYEVVEAGEETVGTGVLGPDGQEIRRPARPGETPATSRPSTADAPQRPRVSDFTVDRDGNMRMQFDDGTTVEGHARRADQFADEVTDKIGENDPALRERINRRRQTRLQRLRSWWRNTRLYRFLRALGRIGVGSLVGAYMTWDQMQELFAQHEENHAALDTLHAIHEVQSASQEGALMRARAWIDRAHYTALGGEIATLLVGLISVGLLTTRVVRMIPAAIPGAGWVVAALIMAVTEGLGFIATRAIERYGPGLFARWFQSEWSSAPGRDPSEIEIEPMTFDVDDEDMDRAIERERANGASDDQIDRVRDELLQGVDMDRIRQLTRPNN